MNENGLRRCWECGRSHLRHGQVVRQDGYAMDVCSRECADRWFLPSEGDTLFRCDDGVWTQIAGEVSR